MSKEWFLDSSTTMWIPYIHLTLTVTPATRRWGLAALHVLSLATAKATTKNCILIFFLLIWIGQMKKDLQKKKKNWTNSYRAHTSTHTSTHCISDIYRMPIRSTKKVFHLQILKWTLKLTFTSPKSDSISFHKQPNPLLFHKRENPASFSIWQSYFSYMWLTYRHVHNTTGSIPNTN